MIFLTLGTHQPFDRLVGLVDRWCEEREAQVFGQIPDPGRAGYRPKNFDWVTSLPPEAYRARFSSAPCVIAHAGMGSIITARSLARPILIFPRRADLGEQRNDHQLATARRFEGTAGITVAYDADELFDAMDRLSRWRAETGATISPFAQPALIEAIRTEIEGRKSVPLFGR